MAYSSQETVSDGLITTLAITIDYNSREDIQVFYNDVRVFLAEGKWAWVGVTDHTIQFTPSPAAGVVVKVQRVSSIGSMRHDFSDGAQFVASNLDDNFNQLLNIVQEIEESGTTGGGPSPGDITASQVGFVPVAGMVSTNVQAAIEELEGDIPDPAINFPLPNAIAAQIGTSERFAREDHVHVGGGSGGGGVDGNSNAVVYAYKKSASPPTDNPGDVTYNFSVAQITLPVTDALANGWTKTIPAAGTDPLYVTAASASANVPTDNIAAAEWATPVVLSQNGQNGTAGLNAATVSIYQRNTVNVAPALPSANVTYQFTPPTVTGLTNGWSTAVPPTSGGEFLFISTATAVGTATTDTIGPSEWAAAQLMARNGLQGTPGANGSNGVAGQRGTLTVYQSGQTSWDDSVATAAIQAVGLGGPFNRDVVTEYGTGFSQTRFYSGGSWIILTAVIDGNLLVTGTVSAAKINGGRLSGVTIGIGTGGSFGGFSMEVQSGGITWIDQLYSGGLLSSNVNFNTDAVYGETTRGKVGVKGVVNSSNNTAGANAVQGLNNFNGTGGLIGPQGLAYDFYANGSGANIGPFTGSHDALFLNGAEVSVGDIVLDHQCMSYGSGVSNTLFEVRRSTQPNQKAAVGVISMLPVPMTSENPPAGFTVGSGRDSDGNWIPIIADNYPEIMGTHQRAIMNSVGEGMMNVVGEGGNIEAGDLIVTSSVPGKGMRQADDLVRSYTVAKARENVTFTGDEVKQVACIYICG